MTDRYSTAISDDTLVLSELRTLVRIFPKISKVKS